VTIGSQKSARIQIWLEPDQQLAHHQATLGWAERLGHSKTYDSAYLAVAEALQAEFWTADRRLEQSARRAGASWVHSIMED
jgi:predicted nucleic acid-binding protein